MDYDYSTAMNNGNVFEENVHIEPGVIIGKNNYFSRNCTVRSNCIIGDNNYFMGNVIIGSSSREVFQGTHRNKCLTQQPMIEIGNDNVFEDNVVIQTSLEKLTKIADHTYIGAFSIISHDVVIEENVIVSTHCSIGGYCIIMKQANLGMGVRVHQRSVVGSMAMIGAGCVVTGHITPFATVVGVPAHFIKVNKVGLMRAGINEKDIIMIEEAFLHGSIDLLPYKYQNVITDFKKNVKLWNRKKDFIPSIN